MEYVSHVLPALGEDAVEQRSVGELVDAVAAERRDPPEVARLKADTRMAEVIAHAVELRLESQPQELVARLEGAYVRVRQREVVELLERAREELGTTAAARERFRMDVLRRFYEDYGRVHGGAAFRNFEEVERALRANGYLDRVLKAAWPVVAPERLVRSLLSSRATLAEAADGILSAEEQKLLVSRAAGWSDGDVALLDEAHTLLVAPPRTFGHVIVDEAQDLTPMQLRMIARRARGGADDPRRRRAGDGTDRVPQLDGGAARASRWRGRQGGGAPARLPCAPRDHGAGASAAGRDRAGRRGPAVVPNGRRPAADPQVEEKHLLAEAYHEAERLAQEEGLLALIVPEELAEVAVEDESLYDGVPVLTPRQAKGLEFDHVVVVEPAAIAERDQGLRHLYVALTRPTKTLVVLRSRELPRELGRS